MPVLTIHRWREIFENADTRKRERLKYFHAPSGTDSRGYLALVSRFPQADAMMAFGIFQALCQLSATLGKEVRGTFKNSDGTAMDLQQLSVLLRIEICHLDAAVKILADKRVAWLRWEPSADDLPVACQSSPGFVQGEGKGKGEGQGEEETTSPSAPTGASSGSEPVVIGWSPEAGFSGIVEADYEQWAKAYPALVIDSEIAKASQWLLANPTKRKKAVRRFVVNWLARAQERGGDRGSRPVVAAPGEDLDRLRKLVASLRPNWGEPVAWSYLELQHLGGAAAQLAAVTDDGWRLLRSYLAAALPQSAGYWQPRERGKFCETFSSVWQAATRWREKGNGPRPTDETPQGKIGYR